MNLTDRLARDRTTLANERTLLAFVRTALMMVLSGVSLIKLLPEWGVVGVVGGAVLSFLGLLTFLWGLRRYAQTKRGLNLMLGA